MQRTALVEVYVEHQEFSTLPLIPNLDNCQQGELQLKNVCAFEGWTVFGFEFSQAIYLLFVLSAAFPSEGELCG